MDGLLSNILTTFKSIHISEKDIGNVNGFVNEKMKLFGWIIIEMNMNMCLIIKLNDKEEIEEGYYLNKDEVIEMNGKDDIITVNDTIDKENGIRFEGSVFEDVPFCFGLLFDENGNRVYEGVIINWKRMGYGLSFHENGLKEYEGYWCNDFRCGNGKSFDIEGNIIYEGCWYNGKEIICDYEGDGSNLNIEVKHLKLLDNCILTCIDVSLFILLEELIIGDECFENVDTFRIDGLNHLKCIKIGRNSFTKKRSWYGNNPSHSFYILNCIELESIEIGRYSFSDYGGEFELKNLPSLSSIKIGIIGSDSYNFCYSSFMVKDLPNLQSIELGNIAFCRFISTVISNLPNLKSIRLGGYALCGREVDSCSLEMKDLPKLEIINSNGYSFKDIRSLTLSNIPNLIIVNLPHSFCNVQTKSISNSSFILVELVAFPENDVDPISTTLQIPNGSWNNSHSFSLYNSGVLESIEIGDECFENANKFKINGLNHLKWIKIGTRSFTNQKDNWNTINTNTSRSFHILNCFELKSIEIGRYSFSDYSGEFELKNLPSLSSIKIDSYNFCYSAFVVKDLPNLQSIELGQYAFHESLSTVISNLPNLKSIKLGSWALCGREIDSCSLEMKDLPKLEIINSNGYSFKDIRSLTLSNIPNLIIVNLPHSFENIQTKLISNIPSLLAYLVEAEEPEPVHDDYYCTSL